MGGPKKSNKELDRQKLGHLAERCRKWAEKNDLEVLCFFEAGDTETRRVGRYTPALVQALMLDLMKNHGPIVAKVLSDYKKAADAQRPLIVAP